MACHTTGAILLIRLLKSATLPLSMCKCQLKLHGLHTTSCQQSAELMSAVMVPLVLIHRHHGHGCTSCSDPMLLY